VADLKCTAPCPEGQFGAFYDVDELTFTVVKIIFQTIIEKCTSKFVGKYENPKKEKQP
jgi:hypothetical protein